MKLKIFLLSIFFLTSFSSTSLHSLEKKYPFRNIKKPIVQTSKADKIIVVSPPRTGSTYLYIIFQYLFETKIANWDSFDKKVVKSHDIENCRSYILSHPNTYVILPIRHPKDSFLSRLKITSFLSQNKMIDLLQDHVSFHINLSKFIEEFPSEKIMVCRYEDFTANRDPLLFEIERKFDVKIPKKEKAKINSSFFREELKKRAQRLRKFSNFDPILGIHGQHISSTDKKLEDFCSGILLEYVLKEIHTISLLFGYDLE